MLSTNHVVFLLYTGELSIDRTGCIDLALQSAVSPRRRRRLIVLAASLSSAGPGLVDYASVNIALDPSSQSTAVETAGPQFPSDLVEARVREGAPRGTTVLRLRPWSPCDGGGGGGRFRYEITAGNQRNEFTLLQSPATSGGGGSVATLRTNVELDREIRSTYRVQVRAVSAALEDGRNGGCVGGSGGTDAAKRHSAVATVVVTVTDVNDNAPFFPANSRPIRIREGEQRHGNELI